MKRCVRYGHQNVSNAIISLSLLGFEQTLDCGQIKSGKIHKSRLFMNMQVFREETRLI